MSNLKECHDAVDKRLMREYKWLTPALIQCLRAQGVDPEDYAKRANRRREDPPGYLGQLPVSPEDQKRIDAEIDQPAEPFDDAVVPDSAVDRRYTREEVEKINKAPFKRRKRCVDHFDD